MLTQHLKWFKILILLSPQQKHIHKGHIIVYSILDIYFHIQQAFFLFPQDLKTITSQVCWYRRSINYSTLKGIQVTSTILLLKITVKLVSLGYLFPSDKLFLWDKFQEIEYLGEGGLCGV